MCQWMITEKAFTHEQAHPALNLEVFSRVIYLTLPLIFVQDLKNLPQIPDSKKVVLIYYEDRKLHTM